MNNTRLASKVPHHKLPAKESGGEELFTDSDNPFLMATADSIRFDATRKAVHVVRSQDRVLWAIELSDTETGLLVGQVANGKTRWRSYNRRQVSFQQACRNLVDWHHRRELQKEFPLEEKKA